MKRPDLPAKASFLSPFTEVLRTFLDNNCLQAGAALAYYGIFSLAPILIVVMTVTGYFLGEQAAQANVFEEITAFVGADNAATIQNVIQATDLHAQSPLLTAITMLGLLLAATGIFGTLELTLNKIWQVDPYTGSALKYYAMLRLRSFGILLLIGVLLLASQLLNGLVNVGLYYFGDLLPTGVGNIVVLVNGVISFLVSTLLFAAVFKTFSSIRNRWTDVLIGGLFTSGLFLIGKYLITLYVSHSKVVSSYGVAGSVVALMLWAYYSSLILLLGACFTYVFSRHREAVENPT